MSYQGKQQNLFFFPEDLLRLGQATSVCLFCFVFGRAMQHVASWFPDW